ncbi:serine/threonine-protein kinase [Streptomyces sp. CB03238]|uniref:serine/threonine-protein kinase n=1 Tax=Streptomyces sp. CB03238 TaxID=1907777 RepID=UPI000A115093|nr:serine/threonine-protein kinase [Streptomyces sp. CB03238]ORT59327.1 serine/threonine protein kinase [Streptomyces sp. CB03238]
MEPLSGEDPVQIGPFRLLGRLGSGGMGRVYLARSAGGRTVAVKVVHAELAAQDEFRRRFAREVAALEKVGGAGTTPVLGADTAAEAPWVAIGYVAGPSLRTVVGDEYGPLPPASVRSLAVGLARALEHIHAAGLVHRDLKPGNVLLTVDGPRIIDFGIARAVDTVTDGGLTSTGAVVGSPGFMSPEQVRGERLSPASDIFCLGSVLAYAATGRPPFGTADSGVHAMMFRIAHDEPDLTGLPAELDGLVRSCLAKDPAARPTAAHLAAHVEATEPWLPAGLLAQLGRLAARLLDEDGEPTPVPHKPRRSRRPLLIGAATVTALAVAGGLAFTFWPRTHNAPMGGFRVESLIPVAFHGAWEGVVKGTQEAPYETARIEIVPGVPGEKTGTYVQVTGERLCMGRSKLVSADENKVVFGESDVTTSVPAKECTPAAHQTLTLTSPDVLQWRSGAVTATFRKVKAAPEVVPPKMVGTWEQVPHAEIPEAERDLYTSEITISQGPIGAQLVHFQDSHPKTDEETGELTGGSLNCASTSVVGGAGGLVVIGPPTLDSGADPECRDYLLGSSQNLRIQRAEGKDVLLVYGMSADGEPGEYVKKY